MKKPLFKQRKKQLRFLSRKLSSLIKSGETENTRLIQRLTSQIKKLLFDMRFSLSKNEAKSILGAAAVFLGLSFNTVAAQSFGPKQSNPFNLQPTDMYFNVPAFADMDGDGDMDLLTNDYYGTFHYYENTGTQTAAHFATPVAAFNLPSVGNYSPVTITDLDGDGDNDILVGVNDNNSTPEGFNYFENIGNLTTPQFAAASLNPFGLSAPVYGALPTFADIDNDGDMDLINGDYYGALHFYENTGTTSSPQFANPISNPFGFSATTDIAIPAFADIDEDGDLDLMVGNIDYYGGATLKYYENSGSNTTPQFTTGIDTPFGINVPYVTTPTFADIDGDADMDIFSMEVYGGLVYFENTSTIGIAEAATFDFKVYPNPATNAIKVESHEVISVINILDLSGRELLSSTSTILDVSHLANGAYFLKLINVDGKFSIQKFNKF